MRERMKETATMSPRTAKPDSEPSPQPSDPDIVALARRIATLRGYQRACSAPVCKRARRCVGPEVRCVHEANAKRPVPTRVLARPLYELRRMARDSDTMPAGEAEGTLHDSGMARYVQGLQALLLGLG